MTTVKYTVAGMNCEGCVRRIKVGVGKVQGVQSVKVDFETKRVEVKFDAPASEDTIKTRLADVSCPVVE